MGTSRKRTRRIAPLRHRVAAGAITGACYLPVMMIGGLVADPLTERFPGAARWLTGTDPELDGSVANDPMRPRRLSWRRRAGWTAVSFAGSVLARNWRSPGQRVMGLRRAEARTGGPISVRTAATAFVVQTASGVALSRLISPLMQRDRRRLDALAPEIEEIRARYRDDERARQMATMAVYRREKVNPFRSCIWGITKIALGLVPNLFDPHHRNLADRVAGIVVLEER